MKADTGSTSLENLEPVIRRLVGQACELSGEDDHQLITRLLSSRLEARPIRTGDLPASCLEPQQDRYARHRLHRCPETGIVVYVMVWGPGQGSPAHDHGGAWGVLGAVRGRLTVEEYRRLDGPASSDAAETQSRDHVRLSIAHELRLEPGQTATTWAPGREIHLIRNDGPDTAVTIHLYSRELESYSVFDLERGTARRIGQPDGDG
jgi:predicted metal-dependent enzyme (double-stranded beta helix superfamily)